MGTAGTLGEVGVGCSVGVALELSADLWEAIAGVRGSWENIPARESSPGKPGVGGRRGEGEEARAS